MLTQVTSRDPASEALEVVSASAVEVTRPVGRSHCPACRRRLHSLTRAVAAPTVDGRCPHCTHQPEQEHPMKIIDPIPSPAERMAEALR